MEILIIRYKLGKIQTGQCYAFTLLIYMYHVQPGRAY